MQAKQDAPTRQPDSYEYEEVKKEDNIDASLNILDLIDHVNVAELLDEKQLLAISKQVLEGYDIDKTSRSHREQYMKEAMNMALNVAQEKNFPWPKASNVIFPLISNASISFAARAYPAIVKDGEVVSFKIVGDDEGQPLIDPRNGEPVINPDTVKPMQDPETGETVPDLSQAQPVWQVEPGAKEERGKRVATYMNYQFSEIMEEWEEDTDKLLNALPVTGNMFRKVYWDTEEERIKSHLVYPANLIINYNARSMTSAPRISEEVEYYPYEIEEMIRAGIWLDGDYLVHKDEELEEQSDREEEGGKGYTDENAAHVFVEQLCRFDLDGDGYGEPYIVTVHKGSDKTVRISADYQKDGIKYVKSKKKKKTIKRIIAETYFIKYGFIPAPDGSIYDMGFGELLLHQNKTINTTINQLLDAGTLSNTSTGLIGRGLRMKGGNVRMKMGEFTTVDSRGGAIKDNFVQIQHPEPSAVVFQLLGLLIESGKDIGSLRDVLQGEQVANQSGIAALALIEQGLTAFKAIYKRISRSIRKEIDVVYRLNQLYLNDDVYANVLDKPMEISRLDFESDDFDIIPVSSPHMVSDQQRLARAQYLDSLREDPYTNQTELRERMFKTINLEDYEKLIVEPPPAPQDPMVEMQQMMIRVEELKAQIKEKERQDKAQKDAYMMELDQAKAEHKAKVDQMQSDSKARESEFKLISMSKDIDMKEADLDIKRVDAAMKAGKTEIEKEKLQVEIVKILADIELAQQKARTDSEGSEQKKAEESTELAEIKKTLATLASKEDLDINQAIKPLIDAIETLKSDGGDKLAVEIRGIINESVAGLQANSASMKDIAAPIADAIRSLKDDEAKTISITRDDKGDLSGKIE